MAKKKKKRLKMPPLSLLDKTIYGLLLACIVSALMLIVFVPIFCSKHIAFADAQVIAYRSRASILYAMPVMFFFGNRHFLL